jgi:hypothetical protein
MPRQILEPGGRQALLDLRVSGVGDQRRAEFSRNSLRLVGAERKGARSGGLSGKGALRALKATYPAAGCRLLVS